MQRTILKLQMKRNYSVCEGAAPFSIPHSFYYILTFWVKLPQACLEWRAKALPNWCLGAHCSKIRTKSRALNDMDFLLFTNESLQLFLKKADLAKLNWTILNPSKKTNKRYRFVKDIFRPNSYFVFSWKFLATILSRWTY